MKFDAMPKELMQFMGMESMQDMGNYMHYFGMIFQIWLIVISFFAASFSGGLIVQEEKRETIEYLYAMPVSRLDIYFSKVAAAFLAVLAVVACTGLSAILCGMAVGGETYDAGQLLLIVKLSGFIPLFLSGCRFPVLRSFRFVRRFRGKWLRPRLVSAGLSWRYFRKRWGVADVFQPV